MKQIRNITLGFTTFMMVFALFSASFAGNRAHPVKRITIDANSSKTMNILTSDDSVIKIKAKADQGKVHIKVLSSDGTVVDEGYNEVKFKSANPGSEFRVVFTNETAKFQKAIVYGSGWDEGVVP